jgi:hypothetical protein
VTQHTNMMAGKRSAPIWALAAIAFLGWNELMAVLWNPVLLVLGLVTFIFGYQMYNELDVDAEMQRGVVLGAVSIWNRLGGVLQRVSWSCGGRLTEGGGAGRSTHAAAASAARHAPHTRTQQVLHHNVELLQNAAGAVAEHAHHGGHQQPQPAYAGAGTGQLQAEQRHSSNNSSGLKQRAAAHTAHTEQDGVQMTALRGKDE